MEAPYPFIAFPYLPIAQSPYGFLIRLLDGDGVIRTAHLTEPAQGAGLQVHGRRRLQILHGEDLARAKLDTDAAPFAPFLIDEDASDFFIPFGLHANLFLVI